MPLPVGLRWHIKILVLTPTLESLDSVSIRFGLLKVQQSSKRNPFKRLSREELPLLNTSKHHREFESLLSVWRTDVLTANTNDAYNISREGIEPSILTATAFEAVVYT